MCVGVAARPESGAEAGSDEVHEARVDREDALRRIAGEEEIGGDAPLVERGQKRPIAFGHDRRLSSNLDFAALDVEIERESDLAHQFAPRIDKVPPRAMRPLISATANIRIVCRTPYAQA